MRKKSTVQSTFTSVLCKLLVPVASIKLIDRDGATATDNAKAYSLPAQAPTIPLRPVKLPATRASSVESEIVPLEAPVPSTIPPSNNGNNKRSAPDTDLEDVPEVVGKKQKVAVVEDDDDDFEIL